MEPRRGSWSLGLAGQALTTAGSGLRGSLQRLVPRTRLCGRAGLKVLSAVVIVDHAAGGVIVAHNVVRGHSVAAPKLAC